MSGYGSLVKIFKMKHTGRGRIVLWIGIVAGILAVPVSNLLGEILHDPSVENVHSASGLCLFTVSIGLVAAPVTFFVAQLLGKQSKRAFDSTGREIWIKIEHSFNGKPISWYPVFFLLLSLGGAGMYSVQALIKWGAQAIFH